MSFGSEDIIVPAPTVILGQPLGSPFIFANPKFVNLAVLTSYQMTLADTFVVVVGSAAEALYLPANAPVLTFCKIVSLGTPTGSGGANFLLQPAFSSPSDTIEGLVASAGGVAQFCKLRESRTVFCSANVGGVCNWEFCEWSDGPEWYSASFVPNLAGSVVAPLVFMGLQDTAGVTIANTRTIYAVRVGWTPPLSAGTLTATLRFNGAAGNPPALVCTAAAAPSGKELIAKRPHLATNAASGAWPIQTTPPGTGALVDMEIVGSAGATGPTAGVCSVAIY